MDFLNSHGIMTLEIFGALIFQERKDIVHLDRLSES